MEEDVDNRMTTESSSQDEKMIDDNKQSSNVPSLSVSTTTDDSTSISSSNSSTATTIRSKSPTSNCILFYGVTYLGCATVNAPKSEAEISRIMATLNEQGKALLEVTMSVPQSLEEKIVLYEATTDSTTGVSGAGGEQITDKTNKISEYKMSHVLFVVRGAKNTPEASCFAFTTCHGEAAENMIFSCHVFRCNLVEAVSKILYSFWTVFNKQNQQNQQQQQQQSQNTSSSSQKSSSSTSNQFSSVASSLLGSIYGGIGSLQSSTLVSSAGAVDSLLSSSGSVQASSNSGLSYQSMCDYAASFATSRIEDQYVFRAILDIKEEDPKNPGANFQSVPKEKEFFKLRKNLDKQISIQIQQMTNQPLEIERCFGILMCQGRNVSHKDMQLLHTVSMGKSGTGVGASSSNAASSGTGSDLTATRSLSSSSNNQSSSGIGSSSSTTTSNSSSTSTLPPTSQAASYANNAYMVRK